MGWTNLQKLRMFETWFEGSSAPTSFRIAFATSAGTWDANTSSVASVTLVPSGNGWTGSAVYSRDGNSLTVSANVTSNYAQADLSSLVVSAIGGDVPAGAGGVADYMRYMLLCDNTLAFIYGWWDLGGQTNIASGQTLTINTAALRGT